MIQGKNILVIDADLVFAAIGSLYSESANTAERSFGSFVNLPVLFQTDLRKVFG